MRPPGSLVDDLDAADIGARIYDFAAQIYPICRSITGDGVRETLRHVGDQVVLQTHEVPTGTRAFDWTVPREWSIRDAFIKNSAGDRVVDFHTCNLHIVSYSAPVHGYFSLTDLKRHIFTLPDRPELIPYRTSYYQESWGFCMAHNQLQALPDGMYEVLIDSTLCDGALTYGEHLHQGESADTVLLSAHICHPSMANDNCSGIALLTQLAKRLTGIRTRYTYRFIFAPGTIGALAWLSRNESLTPHIAHGLVVSGVGDPGGPTYKKTRRGDAEIDRAMTHVLRHEAPSAKIIDFFPYGYDERQYCSPGFNLPVGLFQRSQFGTFPEYHTSADNLDLIQPIYLAESYRILASTLDVLEGNMLVRNLLPKGELQLGQRGLYGPTGGDPAAAAKAMALLWVLNLGDGQHTLLDIATRADMPFHVIRSAAEQLAAHGVLEYVHQSAICSH
jgi:aminopeptidase-like protein